MSSRTEVTLFAVILRAVASSAGASDWDSFVAASDRRDDGDIIALLRDADYQTSVDICRLVGSRADPYAADILSWLLAGFSRTADYKSELLLRFTMAALFDESRGDQAVRARIDANASVLDDMVKQIDRFQDPQLKGILVRLLPRHDSADRLRALMDVGSDIVGQLTRTGGDLTAPETGLAMDYLATAQQIGTQDFLEQCISISRLSRDPALVRAARETAKLLPERSR